MATKTRNEPFPLDAIKHGTWVRDDPATTPIATPEERLAVWMIEHSIATGHGDTFEDLLGGLSAYVRKMQADRAPSPISSRILAARASRAVGTPGAYGKRSPTTTAASLRLPPRLQLPDEDADQKGHLYEVADPDQNTPAGAHTCYGSRPGRCSNAVRTRRGAALPQHRRSMNGVAADRNRAERQNKRSSAAQNPHPGPRP